MFKTLLASVAACALAVSAAQATVLTGTAQLIGDNGFDYGTISASLDTDATRAYDCLTVSNDGTCAAPGEVRGVLTLTFPERLEEFLTSEETFFIDPDLGAGTIAPSELTAGGRPLFGVRAGTFEYNTTSSFVGTQLDIESLLGDTIIGVFFATVQSGSITGSFSLTIDGLDDYLSSASNPVPLPAGAVLFLTGAAGLAARRRLAG